MSTFRANVFESMQLTHNLLPFEFWLNRLATRTAEALKAGNKILLCGNGGSAADAAHIATEFTCRFRLDRQAYPAMALGVDGGLLTAIGNDYNFTEIFARQVSAFGQSGDIFIGISTSGNSVNVERALDVAMCRGLRTALFLGKGGGDLADTADYQFIVESNVTARIQEAHQFLLHEYVRLVEAAL